ncbi:MAG: hypothetical protein K6V36_04510 [Anaerolineae bacterium]|nr:hypothetical protein [Anaerolineae bacterium]
MDISAIPASLGRSLVRALDALLRRCLHVRSFAEDAVCILRVSCGRAREAIVLQDGTQIRPGDPVIDIHFWNERVPPMPESGPDLRWAREMHRRFVASLRLLAQHLMEASSSDGAAIRGEFGFLSGEALDAQSYLFRRLGLEVRRLHAARGAWGRFAEFWQNLFSYWLIWTYNPASLRGKRLLDLERCEVWISRQALLARYGARPHGPQLSAFAQSGATPGDWSAPGP